MKHEVDTDFSSLLSTIQKVDAPPFLLTRIKEKIKTNPEIKIGLGWVFAGSVDLGREHGRSLMKTALQLNGHL